MSKLKPYRGTLTTIAGTALSLFLSSQALATTTFTGTRDTGNRTATYSITTDDTLGAIGTSQITSWAMSITDGGLTQSFSSLDGGSMQFSGLSLFSTGTDLLFNYDSVGYIFAAFFSAGNQSGLYMQAGYDAGNLVQEDLIRLYPYDGSGWQRGTETGLQSIASVPREQIGAVPEPGTWAMMLLGFGAIGLSMRRRRNALGIAQLA